MLPRPPAYLWLVKIFALCFSFLFPPGTTTQTVSDRSDLRGKVINSVTGEPVGGALVQLSGQEMQFSQSDGSFVFTNLPRGQVPVIARKPGFFNDRDLGRWGQLMVFSGITVPAEADVIVKLIPEGIIFGQVKNESGEPLDGITVRAQRRQVTDGRSQLQSAGETITDDEGNFRIAELLPGNYYLAFLPTNRGGAIFTTLKRKTHAEDGYGLQFYPGTSDVASASVLQIRAGAQLNINHTFIHQRVFDVAGILRPADPEKSFSVELVNSSGEPVQKDIRLNPKTGEFQITAVPAGTYLLRVTSFGRRPPDQALDTDFRTSSVALPVHVNADLSGLVLHLGSGVAATVQIHDETQRDPGPSNVNQVFVNLVSRDFPSSVLGMGFPPPPGDRQLLTRFENLAPGIYTVEARPTNLGYVASLRCGTVDLLRDDLTIAPGAAPPPIEVTLRSDSAQMMVTLTNGPSAAGLIVYSQEYPRRSILVPIYNGNASVPNLAPGSYQVIALADVSELEYRNPAVIGKYLIHAIPVTLQPGDSVTVRLEIGEPPEPHP